MLLLLVLCACKIFSENYKTCHDFCLSFSYDYVTPSRSNAVGTADEHHYEVSESVSTANGHGATATTTAANNQSGLSPAPRYETSQSFVASNAAATPPSSQHYAVSYATPGITQSRNFMEVSKQQLYCVCVFFVQCVPDSYCLYYSGNLWSKYLAGCKFGIKVRGRCDRFNAKFVFLSTTWILLALWM